MQFSKSKGFTIIEMLVYSAGLIILMTVLSEIFVSIFDAQMESQAISSVEQDGRYVLSRLSYDLARASSVSTPAVLGIPSPNLAITVGTDSYTYQIQNGNLIITINSTPYQINGFDTSVSNLTFLKLGNTGGKNSIRASYTVTSRSLRKSGPEVKNFQTTLTQR